MILLFGYGINIAWTTGVIHLDKQDLEKLREKLYLLISEKSDYSEILKVSQELDNYIVEFTSGSLDSKNRELLK